jgi:hypothetical protein
VRNRVLNIQPLSTGARDEGPTAALTTELLARLKAGLMYPTRPIDDARRDLLRLLREYARPVPSMFNGTCPTCQAVLRFAYDEPRNCVICERCGWHELDLVAEAEALSREERALIGRVEDALFPQIRECPARPCLGGPRGPWCGRPSRYVVREANGLERFACAEHHDERGDEVATPIATWFSDQGLPFPEHGP